MGVFCLCFLFAVWMWLLYPDAVIGFGSRKEEYVDKIGEPKSLFRKMRQFIGLLPQEFRHAGWNEHKHAPCMEILNLENGSSIVGETGDNIGRRNRTSIYLQDESAFCDRPDAIDAALSHRSNCTIDISTPNGAGNSFYRKRHGGRLPVFTFDWRQDSRKGQACCDQQCRDPDAVIAAQEIDIDYSASVTDSFIPNELVLAAQALEPADAEALGPVKPRVNVARFGATRV